MILHHLLRPSSRTPYFNVQRDNRRSTYNLKEQKLAKAYIVALGLDEKSVPAKRLLSWKVPTPADVSFSPEVTR